MAAQVKKRKREHGLLSCFLGINLDMLDNLNCQFFWQINSNQLKPNHTTSDYSDYNQQNFKFSVSLDRNSSLSPIVGRKTFPLAIYFSAEQAMHPIPSRGWIGFSTEVFVFINPLLAWKPSRN